MPQFQPLNFNEVAAELLELAFDPMSAPTYALRTNIAIAITFFAAHNDSRFSRLKQLIAY
ncbi:hypothetical protein [Scytonema sp. PRP1]|uniref:hypothetical protein n=1 Tax=Scytonema sp. PRP1 TaxID=3120513 RepID=UPI002FD6A298